MKYFKSHYSWIRFSYNKTYRMYVLKDKAVARANARKHALKWANRKICDNSRYIILQHNAANIIIRIILYLKLDTILF